MRKKVAVLLPGFVYACDGLVGVMRYRAGASLWKGERPRALAMCGLAANLVLAGLFWCFRFYAVGFDQDAWTPR